MTKKLEELFNLASIDLDEETVPEFDTPQVYESTEVILNEMSASEKVDSALTSVSGLSEHDKDMDDISKKAMKSYGDLVNLGMNVQDSQAARIFEVANMMLQTALSAKNSKVNRKLKTVELQLKMARLEHDKTLRTPDNDDDDSGEKSGVFDRNELVRMVQESIQPQQITTQQPTNQEAIQNTNPAVTDDNQINTDNN